MHTNATQLVQKQDYFDVQLFWSQIRILCHWELNWFITPAFSIERKTSLKLWLFDEQMQSEIPNLDLVSLGTELVYKQLPSVLKERQLVWNSDCLMNKCKVRSQIWILCHWELNWFITPAFSIERKTSLKHFFFTELVSMLVKTVSKISLKHSPTNEYRQEMHQIAQLNAKVWHAPSWDPVALGSELK